MCAGSPIGLNSGAMRAHQMMRGNRGFKGASMPRGQYPLQIPAIGDHPRFIKCRPFFDPIIHPPVQGIPIVCEPMRHVWIQPPAKVVQRCRQIPVIERRSGSIRFQKTIDQFFVEIEAFLIQASFAFGKNAPPGHRKPVSLQSQLFMRAISSRQQW